MGTNPEGPVGPRGSGSMSEGVETKMENEQCLDLLNWEEACLSIGVPRADGQNTPWEEGNEEDYKLLANLLTKPLKIISADGSIISSPALSEGSPFLRKLGRFAQSAAEYQSRRSRRTAESLRDGSGWRP
jgi:hypothetical protein